MTLRGSRQLARHFNSRMNRKYPSIVVSNNRRAGSITPIKPGPFQIGSREDRARRPCRTPAALQGLSGIGIPSKEKPRHITLAHYVPFAYPATRIFTALQRNFSWSRLKSREGEKQLFSRYAQENDATVVVFLFLYLSNLYLISRVLFPAQKQLFSR
jgi:hypothetical protein